MNQFNETKQEFFRVRGYSLEIDEKAVCDLNQRGVDEMRDINERLQLLMERAPSDAAAEVHVRKSREGYKGVLKIYSQQRRFVGGFASPRFAEVVDRIFEEVRTQIDEWKMHRDLSSDHI